MERIKRADNAREPTGFYFWRTYDQKEIDLIEDRNGKLSAFECKWSPTARVKAPADWPAAYPDAQFTVATRDNWQAHSKRYTRIKRVNGRVTNRAAHCWRVFASRYPKLGKLTKCQHQF
jgi:hypothetical protein